MTYTITYNGESGNVADEDKVFGILGTLLSWVDENQADYTRRYVGITHDGQNGLMVLKFVIEDIPDSDPPSTAYATIDDLIQNDINTPNATDFPLSAEGGATIR